jgi:proline iminopeptidase
MPELFPLIEPYDSGMLDVGDGQQVYWEVSGNPDGKPAVALHGGPGSGLSPERRRLFDPDAYCFVQFDQRGCGRSTPSVADPSTSLETNTTDHLIGDIEKLREHLGIDRWLVWGRSWGVTLGVAYAERHPERVSEMVLVSGTLTRSSDVHWLYNEAGRFFPEQWRRYAAGAGNADDLVAAYNTLLNEDPDPGLQAQAARDWCAWEDAVNSLDEGWTPSEQFADPGFRMTFARLCAHYFSHTAWLDDNQLLRDAHRLTGIPAVMIHGRFDIQGPPEEPWLLHQAWPDSELYLVRAGHTGGDEVNAHTLTALNRFVSRALCRRGCPAPG